MKLRVDITLKEGVLDPQGKAIARALGTLGFSGINEVKQGKVIFLDIEENDPDAAIAAVDSMSRKLLANMVIETFHIEILG